MYTILQRYLQSYLQRYIKDLFLSKWIGIDFSDLIQNTRRMWTYKKKCSPKNLFQNNRELFQSSLSEPTAGKCHEKSYPKRIQNINKYSGQSPLLAKL